MDANWSQLWTKMIWVVFITLFVVGGLILVYKYMPPEMQAYIMEKIEWAFSKVGIKIG